MSEMDLGLGFPSFFITGFSVPKCQKNYTINICQNDHFSILNIWYPLLIQIFHILNPFDRKERFLLVVAFLAACDKIVLRAFTSSSQRNDMIHGQIFRLKRLGAIIAGGNGKSLLPPAAFAQLSGFLLLPADFCLIDTVKMKEITHMISPSNTFLASPIR